MNIRVVRGTVKQYSGVSLYKHVLGFVYCLLCVWQRFLYLYAPLTLTWNLNSDITVTCSLLKGPKQLARLF